jgi:hypothetical protein
MGFLGFGNILGFKHYFGKTEYNHDEDFDGCGPSGMNRFCSILLKM